MLYGKGAPLLSQNHPEPVMTVVQAFFWRHKTKCEMYSSLLSPKVQPQTASVQLDLEHPQAPRATQAYVQ